MAYAIFKTGGKQYRVAEGDVVDVEKLDVEPGAQTTFSEVLFYTDGGNIRTGADLQGATVAAEVVDQVKAKKILAYKYKRRKGYHRSVGHRRRLTRLKITGINL